MPNMLSLVAGCCSGHACPIQCKCKSSHTALIFCQNNKCNLPCPFSDHVHVVTLTDMLFFATFAHIPKCLCVLQFPELGGPMANHNMQGPFSPGSAPHSPAGPPGLMMAGPMPHPEYMHPHAMGAGGQYIPIPMQVSLFPRNTILWMPHVSTHYSSLSPTECLLMHGANSKYEDNNACHVVLPTSATINLGCMQSSVLLSHNSMHASICLRVMLLHCILHPHLAICTLCLRVPV